MTIYELPSLVALIFKGLLLGYALRSGLRTSLTRLFFTLLMLLSIFNLIEFAGLQIRAIWGLIPAIQQFGYTYFAVFIPTLAVILHISLRLSLDEAGQRLLARHAWLLYLPILPLEALLLFSDLLVAGFEPFQYTVLRIPGPLYFLFESYAALYLLAALSYLVYGARARRAPIARTRNRLWLLGLAPMALLAIYLVVANHFGWTRLTSTFYLPITMTLFLVVTTYATHRYRLFDITFYIPWSRVRRRKTAFYGQLQAMLAELGDIRSAQEAINRLAETLHCPVALLGGSRPIAALAGASQQMIDIPKGTLRNVNEIVVRAEIAELQPGMHAILQKHGVSAVVPFYPHTHAEGWLLLGESFSDQVYSTQDFRMVEQVFARLADLFLDRLLNMRAELAESARRVLFLEGREQQLAGQVAALQGEIGLLRESHNRLLRDLPADPQPAGSNTAPATLVLLSRDKSLARALRAPFPQLASFVDAGSSGFRKLAAPELLVCEIDSGDAAHAARTAELLTRRRGPLATLLLGNGATEFARRHAASLQGLVCEVLPGTPDAATVIGRITALDALRRQIHGLPAGRDPLIGLSPGFAAAMREAGRLAAFETPLWIETTDAGQAEALAVLLHERSGRKGDFRSLDAGDLPGPEQIATMLPDATGSTLFVRNMTAGHWQTLRHRSLPQTRLILAGAQADAEVLAIRLPALPEREDDLPALVQYFTLQYNLQAGTRRWLSRAEVESELAQALPETLDALRRDVTARLNREPLAAEPSPGDALIADEPPSGRTLDERVAEFESRLIADTLQQCGGNKSRAARLLGLRPNTLHYKLERYGLGEKKKG